MLSLSKHERLEKLLQERGYSPVFQPEGDLLIIRLPAAEQERLLANEPLRQDLAAQARAFGFSRLALEITTA